MAGKRPFRTSQNYSTIEVNVDAIPIVRHPQWCLLGPEELEIGGAAPKNLLVVGNRVNAQCTFIAKKPRRWLRECVTEAIISTVGQELPISLAKFDLVRLPSAGSEPDVRFLSRVFLKPDESLVHGVEVAGRYFQVHKDEVRTVFDLDDKKSEREFYTIDVIVDMLRSISRDAHELARLLDGFSRMVVFDAFVGAQDRHAENWGIIESVRASPLRFAPIYDTARGLFVSHAEEKLVEMDTVGRRVDHIAKYAEGSKPVFGCRCEGDVRQVNHFRLVEHLVNNLNNQLGRSARHLVGAINMERIEKRLRIRFARAITKRRMDFIVDLLRYRQRRLKETVFLGKS